MHAHAQIEYSAPDGCVESLIGFNPNDASDRKMIHDMLDEYLDFLANKMAEMESRDETKWEDLLHDDSQAEGFRIYPLIDTH